MAYLPLSQRTDLPKMSRQMNTSSTSSTSTSTDRINVFVRKCLSDIENFERVPDWARHHARDYFHSVCRQPGFLPVYHALYNAGYDYQKTAREAFVKRHTEATRQTRSTPVTRENAIATQQTRLTRETIFEEAWPSHNNFSCLSEWARAHARNYFHQLNGSRTFLSIYKDLLAQAERMDDAENVDDASYSESEADDETLSYTSSEGEETFATEGRPTRAESDEGKRQLNAICFREYRAWYDAFQEEEREGDSVLTADERFGLHVARILRNKTGMHTDSIRPVIEAWLVEHKSEMN